MILLRPDPNPVPSHPGDYKHTSTPGAAGTKKRTKLTKKARARLAKARRLNHRNH